MSKKRLNITEALELFKNLPSDDESNESSESDTEDYISEYSDSSKKYDDDDENLPGPSRSSKVLWRKKGPEKKRNIEFTQESGPSEDITSLADATPISIFLTLFSISFIEIIVYQTNLYGTQKGGAFIPVTLEEMINFFAINLVMGMKTLPSYRDFWSTNEILHDDFISRLMPVRKFVWILGNLHLNDNSLQPQRTEKNFDKLYKVRPLIDYLSETFLKALKPGQKQSIDESIIKFKGRSSLKQYMPKKPIKRGYKVWMRCDQCGFACEFQIYTGKTDEIERNLGEIIIKNLSQKLLGKNHIVFFDNYFTSYKLLKYLDS